MKINPCKINRNWKNRIKSVDASKLKKNNPHLNTFSSTHYKIKTISTNTFSFKKVQIPISFFLEIFLTNQPVLVS